MNYIFSDKVNSVKGSIIREMFKLMGDPEIISFAGGAPAPELYPKDELAEIAGEILKEQGRTALAYGVTQGYKPLLDFVRERERKAGNLHDGEDVMITAGGNQAIDQVAKIMINEGDTVICENPSFIGVLNSFRSYGAKLKGIPCEADGMDMNLLEDALKTEKNVKIIYTIPTFQNPSGITMSLEKRKKLLELAKQYGVMIIEDNPYGNLRFDGEAVPTVKSLDDGNTVVYAGSFSKTLSPGLRVGYCIGCEELMERLDVCKQVNDVHTGVLNQMLVAEFFKRNDFDAHVKKMAELYRHRCHKMLEALEREMPDYVTWTKPQGGLFIWCTIHKDVDTLPLSRKAIEQKVAFVPGCTFMDDMDKPCSSFRLNYSCMDDERIEKGIKILGNVLKEL